jgi:hypothetical protein
MYVLMHTCALDIDVIRQYATVVVKKIEVTMQRKFQQILVSSCKHVVSRSLNFS